jgi:iron uptake system component EfeO
MVNVRRAALAAVPLALLAAGCSKSEQQGTQAAAGPIAVQSTDTECKVDRTEADAGTITFEVANKGTKATEFYLYGEGNRIMGEVENIGPGLTRRMIVEVTEPGTYTTACKPGQTGDGIRAPFTVKGSANATKSTNGALADAVASYRSYVHEEAEDLVTKTTEFAEAVKAKDVEKAKALYPIARIHWERIEPVAESFGDIDPKIDIRDDGLEAGQQFTGFHRLERDLWRDGLQPDSAMIADELIADVNDLEERTESVELTAVGMANGAKELLDEVATGKVTGEEDRYSHTDLYDFHANVEGSKAAIDALRPIIDAKDKDLGTTLDAAFHEVDELLEQYREGEGFKPYTALTAEDVKKLSEAVDALGEPLSKVAGVVASA